MAEAGPASPLFSAAPVPATQSINGSSATTVVEQLQANNQNRQTDFIPFTSHVDHVLVRAPGSDALRIPRLLLIITELFVVVRDDVSPAKHSYKRARIIRRDDR